ncbi:hypothetical protein KAI78_00070 [bacterium]|nr:hypothetical protein [bacterium]
MKKVVYFSVISLLIIAGLFMTGCLTNEKGLDPDNRAPMINFFDVFPQTVVRNNTVTVTVNYTDYDGDVVEFSIVADPERTNPEIAAPPAVTDDPDIFKWYSPRTAGRYWFRATGSDGNFTTESVFSIIVLSRPPNVEWNGAAPANPITYKVEVAATKQSYFIDIQDDDSDPASTVTATISVVKQDAADTWADEFIVNIYENTDTDALTIDSALQATIILETPVRTVMLSVEAYYPEGPEKVALIAGGPWSNTVTLTFDFVDESGYSDSIVQVIKLRN